MPRNKTEASARAQEKVALQSEVTPEAKRSKDARRADVREASERFKRIAEASALALALEEEKVALQSEVTPEAKRSKRSKRSTN